MARNCGIAIALWIALAGGYFWFLRTRLEMPLSLIVALVIATIVWVALVNMHAARLAYADWQARNRMARGERPHDGDLVSAVGELRPTFEPLRSPLRGTPCVAYTYKIGPRGEVSEGPTPDYAGFAATRCAVQTPYGSFQLGSFPLFEDNVARDDGDPAIAQQYVASTQFEEIDGLREVATSMFALFKLAPPFRKDWRIGGEPRIDVTDADLEEHVLRVGEVVTAIGRFDAATNSIVSDVKDKGYLRISHGGEARRVSSVPSEAIQKLIGGIVAVIASNAVLWWILQQFATRADR